MHNLIIQWILFWHPFELVFEPQAGPVWLRVRGTAEIKTFIGNLMAGEDADPGIVP